MALRTSTPRALERLTFGLVPVEDNANARVELADFCLALGPRVGVSVLPHIASSPEALASAVRANRVQLAWLSPTLLVTTRDLPVVVPLASSVREGAAAYHAVLFVAEHSHRKTLADLRGARAAWVAPSSGSGYLFPRIALAQKGLDPATLFASERFCNSHGAVAAAVFDGTADVGATFAVFEGCNATRPMIRAGYRDVRPGHDGRVVGVAGPIPADVIVALPGVSATMRTHVGNALVDLCLDPASKGLLKSLFGVDGFRLFSADSLHRLKSLVDAGQRLGVVATSA